MQIVSKKLMPPIGVFGGTFDPIHLGHIHFAREMLRQLELDKILFVPCFRSAHNKNIQAEPEQRLEMVKSAIADQPKFAVDDREIRRGGISYMVETLEALRKELPTTPLCLSMGKDAFAKFTTWRRWQSIRNLAHIIIADREDHRLPKQSGITEKKYLFETLAGKIFYLSINSLPISATEIRSAIKRGDDVQHLLPERVWRYIVQNSLYQQIT